ncbi:hypothetical protein C8Q78DRAFT_994517 [Trametes maxima]|nr:hypothetical protein C8Q78DRAFT_994517 [Trametes maxima]
MRALVKRYFAFYPPSNLPNALASSDLVENWLNGEQITPEASHLVQQPSWGSIAVAVVPSPLTPSWRTGGVVGGFPGIEEGVQMMWQHYLVAPTVTPSSSSPSNSLSLISPTPGWIQTILGLSGQDYQDLQGHTLSSEQFQVGRGIQLLLRALAAQELPNENHHVHCGLKAEGHPAGADTIHHPVFRNGGYYVPNTGNSAYTITEMITVIFLVDGASEHLSYEMHIVNTFDTH